ncbi:hypothetical protein [Streptomyces sp. NPDC001436]
MVFADSVELTLLVVLESLRPGERLAFALHDLFAVPFDETGTILTPAGVTVVLGATKIAAGARPAAGGTGPRWTALVNGLPGVVSWGEDGSPLSVPAFTVVGGRIFGIRAVTHPAELALMDVPDPGGRLRP